MSTLLVFGMAVAQEGVVENFELGKKVSPYSWGVAAPENGIAAALFATAGLGYETNVFDAASVFDPDPQGAELVRHLPTEVNIPREDLFVPGVVGAEIGARFARKHSLRLILAGQLNRYMTEELANRSAFDAFLAYRLDIGEGLRMDWESQLDRHNGTSTYMTGIPAIINLDEFWHIENSLHVRFETITADWIGRGTTELMGQIRTRNYDPANLDASFELGDTTLRVGELMAVSLNDSLEQDYTQYRIRLRQLQGLWYGVSMRLAGDYIYRKYDQLHAKMTEYSLGEIPLDRDGEPQSPHRSQHEVRLYGGLQYDPPHLNDMRISIGIEGLFITDPYQDFYGYDQWSIKVSAYYRPKENPLRHLSLSLASKRRTWHELKANYYYGTDQSETTPVNETSSPLIAPDRDNGEPTENADGTYDWSFADTPLRTEYFELSLRGQIPFPRYVALWALYGIDIRSTNRMSIEYYSREYFNQTISAGLTFFVDVLGNRRGSPQ